MLWMKWLIDRGAAATLSVLMIVTFAGCASHPPRYTDGVNALTIERGVRDARAQRVEGWPCLRVNAALKERLDRALHADEMDVAREAAFSFVDGAHALALDSAHNELARLDAQGWRELMRVYFHVDTEPTSELKQRLTEAFDRRTDLQHWFLRQRIDQAESVQSIRAALTPIVERIETPVAEQGRLGRTLTWLPLTPISLAAIASIHGDEYTGDMDAAFESAVTYRPASQAEPPGSRPRDWDLLMRHAPTLVQESPAETEYPARDNRIGTVTAPSRTRIAIDPDDASVYAYARRIDIAGRTHTQLTYTWWYPEHPPLEPNDPEAGHIDGVTLRITLDRADRPAIFETVYNCGCFHRLYAVKALECAAAAQHGKPQKEKRFSLEKAVPGRIDLIVPKLVDRREGRSLTTRIRAGWHGIVDVAFGETHPGEPRTQRTYTLRPYRALELLHTPAGEPTSMFYDNGLVKGAQRLEGVFFTPAGLLSAGQPRQRGTQLIHWDHWRFDDPDLFEKTLRLPKGF